MNNNGWRNGVCGQHYHVQRLKSGGAWLDLRKFDAQMFVLDPSNGIIVVTRNEKILGGLVRLQDAAGSSARRIEAIEYCISACDGRKVITEDFLHDFKRPVVLRQPDLAPWHLAPIQGKLFTLRPLNDILTARSFGQMNGAQFCC
jgi:hypothetical protein